MNRKKIASLILATSIVTTQVATPVFANTNDNNVTEVTSTQDNKEGEVNKNTRSGVIVNIPDPNLKAELNKRLGQSPTSNITKGQLRGLKGELNLYKKGISNLEGLQYCTGISDLNLEGNNMNNISPLKDLVNLGILYIGGNDNISDFTPLRNLKNLWGLSVAGMGLDSNGLSKVLSNLTNPTNFTYFHIGWNEISDISPLKKLVNLTRLHMEYNKISDITPVSNLKKLGWISMYNNNISDISPISSLSKTLYRLSANNNKISDISPLANLNKLSALWLENQRITGPKVTAIDSNATVNNIVKNINGSLIAPTSSNSYSYNSNTGQITFNNINSTGDKAYNFSTNVTIGKAKADFSGSVTQKVIYNIDKSGLQQLVNTAKDKVANGNLIPNSIKALNAAISKAEG
ncbi:MAG: Ig-like domain-containing protein, partial [Clostridium sp.]|nr:Ig-like domain-containing protein [Clostridium sp.]